MRVTRPTELLNRRQREQRNPSRPRRRDVQPAPAPAPTPGLQQERRLRESGGPDDRAHYTCSCGFAFDAAVSTTVACPHCGTAQAW